MLVVNNLAKSRARVRDEQELITLARRGNRTAYEQLVLQHQNRAFAVAFDIMRAREDAEDVLQDALVKAYRGLKNFKGDSKFSTWLYRIVYTTAIDAKRKRARRGGETREYDEGYHGASDENALFANRYSDPLQSASQKQELGMVQQALASLSEEHRRVVVLREVEGLAYDEIADVTGVSRGTVMSRLFYARKKLASLLGKRSSESESEELSRQVAE